MRCCASNCCRVSVRSSGTSPLSTSKSPSKSMRGSSNCCTAWPVPFWGCWSTNCGLLGCCFSSVSSRSAWCPTINSVRLGCRDLVLANTRSTRVAPARGWSTFGRLLFMRVPFPAASTATASIGALQLGGNLPGVAAANPFLPTFSPAIGAGGWAVCLGLAPFSPDRCSVCPATGVPIGFRRSGFEVFLLHF